MFKLRNELKSDVWRKRGSAERRARPGEVHRPQLCVTMEMSESLWSKDGQMICEHRKVRGQTSPNLMLSAKSSNKIVKDFSLNICYVSIVNKISAHFVFI